MWKPVSPPLVFLRWQGLGIALFLLLQLAACVEGQQPVPYPTVRYAQLGMPTPLDSSDRQKFSLETPAPVLVFRVESEAALLKRIELETRRARNPIEFPKEKIYLPSGTPYYRMCSPPMNAVRVPYVVCYGPIYFDDKNSERYGWDLGPIQPLVSTGIFCYDTLTLPLNLLRRPPFTHECNSGYYLPGDPVPYKLYLHP